MDSELSRSFQLGLLKEADGDTILSSKQRWVSLLSSAATSMYELGLKDFRDNLLKPAWSIMFLVDPMIGPFEVHCECSFSSYE